MHEDDELMTEVQSGSAPAFRRLVDKYERALVSFLFLNTRDWQLAEDLTQDTLLKVYDQAWDYLPVGKFRAWMYRIARNLLIDTVRRRAHDALVKAVQGDRDEESLLAQVAAEVVSAEETADHRELAGHVDEILQQLPEEQRLTFTLHHFSGLSLAEVAAVLDTSVPTTKSRLRLAREKLQDGLKLRGFFPPDPDRRPVPETS
jgi:RNA polymerase sigma-70 factor (ECF subfamily)